MSGDENSSNIASLNFRLFARSNDSSIVDTALIRLFLSRLRRTGSMTWKIGGCFNLKWEYKLDALLDDRIVARLRVVPLEIQT